MKNFTRVAIALIPLLLCGSAYAQSLTEIKGNVLVSRGTGYVPVKGTATLSAGNMIMAKPGSSAVLVYAAGCRVNVLPGSIVTVSATPLCEVVGGIDPNALAQEGGLGGINPAYIIIPLAVVVGGFLIYSDDTGDNAVSP